MKKLLRPILMLATLVLLQNCSPNESKMDTSADKTANQRGSKEYWVKNAGSRLNIIKKGDLSSSIELDSVLHHQGLFAVGPIEDLKGEITIYNGNASIATIEKNKPVFSSNTENINAIFLAYGSASKWNHFTIDKTLTGLTEIESCVRQALIENGLDEEKPFPFRIEGHASAATYHIIYKNNDTPHNKTEHHKAKRPFKLNDEDVKIVGFWADSSGEGVYTHPGKRTHLHVVSENNSSGHLDNIQLAKGATLYLPSE